MNELTISEQKKIENLEAEIITLTQQAQKVALVYICELGKRLSMAKDMVGHGNWGRWLEEKVHYSQSTAENYIKIYNEFGSDQISIFGENSETFQNLSYTKLLALTALTPDEREEFAENNDIESVSVRELQEMIAQYKHEKQRAEDTVSELEEEKERLDAKVQEAEEKIAELEEKLQASESQQQIGNDEDIEHEKAKIRAEYEDKLNKAKEDKKKAEAAKAELQKKFEEEKEKIKAEAQKEAESKLDEKIREQTKAIEDEKNNAIARSAELERKVKAAQQNDIAIINVYFGEIQNYLIKMAEAFAKVKEADTEMYTKLSAGVKSQLRNAIDEI